MAIHSLLSILLVAALGPQGQAPAAVSAPAAPTAQASTPPSAPAAGRAVPDSYTIGSNDQLAITVFGEDDLSNKYRVDESGMVTFPLIGRVQAAGKTIVRFQEDLAKLLSAGYLKNPQVRVDVDTYKSQSVTVFGAVRNPQKITMTGQLTLLDALAQAGSPTSDASDDVQIAHSRADANPGDGQSVPAMGDDVRMVKISQLKLGRGNIPLQDGDIVYVPPAQHFTISGQVKNSGSYVWEDGLTVEMALARAGGLTERGSDRRISAHRMVNGRMRDIDLKPQDKVQAGDTIKVGEKFF